jgi:ADP-ribosylglycohydrolase
LEAALWAFHRTDTFRDGCLAAVNLGEDADTTGAGYGQIAGAFYGYIVKVIVKNYKRHFLKRFPRKRSGM